MDARAANGGMDRWNVYYRSSTNGGSTWSSEKDISTYVSGHRPTSSRTVFASPSETTSRWILILPDNAHAVWGEGYDYDSPGSIWYSQGK